MTEGNGEVRELPEGWVWTYLGKLGTIVAGGTPSTKIAEYWRDEVSWVSPVDLSGYTKKFISRGRKSLSKLGLESSSAQLMPSGSILFTSRAPIGYVVIAANEICTNQGFKSLVPSKEIFNKYVYYYLNRSKNLAEKYASGTTFKELSAKSFSILPIPLPPFNEQKRIVEKIEEVFSDLEQGIESLKTAQKQLKVYRQVVLKWAFEGKLTEKWRSQIQQEKSHIKTGEELLAQIKTERENLYQQQLAEWEEAVREWEAISKIGKRPTKPQKRKALPPVTHAELNELPKLPNDWCWVKLGEITEVSGGLTKNSKKNVSNLKLPYLRVANVYANRLELTEVFEIGLEKEEVERVLLKQNDLLIVEKNGSIEQIGRVAIWSGKINLCVHQNHLIKAKSIVNINVKCVLYFLLSHQGRELIKREAGSTSDLYTLSLSKVENLKIPLSSEEEQDQIVQEIESRLSICDQLEATIAENLQKAEALRQSILKQAFEGKLVPQDPNDEPAEKLLERIKQEKLNRQKDKQLSIHGV